MNVIGSNVYQGVLLCNLHTKLKRCWLFLVSPASRSTSNPPVFFLLWNSICQGSLVVSILMLSSAPSLGFCVSSIPPPPHTSVQSSSEACSWLRPHLFWADDAAGGQSSGSSLKKSRQIKDKKYWGKKEMYDPLCEQPPPTIPHLCVQPHHHPYCSFSICLSLLGVSDAGHSRYHSSMMLSAV